MNRIEIRQDIGGAGYVELINYGFMVAREGYFVVRNDLPRSSRINELIASLGQNISGKEVSEWPGTRLHGGLTATLYAFTLEEAVRPIILNATDHLCGWTQPDLAEDIGFVDANAKVLIESTTHEEYLSLLLDDLKTEILKTKYPILWRVLATTNVEERRNPVVS